MKIIRRVLRIFLGIDISNTKSKYHIKSEKDIFYVYKKFIPYVFTRHKRFEDLNEAIKYINQ
tara:strand:- start:29 stop:214 length:186 start_codon:yes stop_codon:yes gene_type:complete